jgi:antagonist of KipI
MTIVVERPGLHTTVQDLGRPGHQHEGVPVGGAMDDVALRVANLLVGNAPGAAALEATLAGPVLRFERKTRIALAGADLGWTVDGRPVAPWRSVVVPTRGVVAVGEPRTGCRGYLAVAGGLEVPVVIGSRATYAPARIGGLHGRALRAGDVLPLVRDTNQPRGADRVVVSSVRPGYGDVVRLVLARHAELLSAASRARLLDAPFRVSAHSDRMGVRLETEGAPFALETRLEPLSAGVAMGTVQLPAGGAPIILMADRPTTGGYLRLGEVATVDLPVVAQLRPGDRLRFTPVSLAEAQRLYLVRERELALLARVLDASP